MKHSFKLNFFDIIVCQACCLGQVVQQKEEDEHWA